jgi:Subtilase family
MTPARTRSRRATALAVAGVALCCAVASPATALQSPERESLPVSGPGSPLTLGNRLVLEVHFERGALAARDDLRRAGARVLDASRREQVVTVAARPGELKDLREVPGAESPSRVLTPVTSATCGSVISEGDTQLAADQARADFGVDGSGVTVGILSDSFDRDGSAPTHAAQDVASGDLPGSGNPCGRGTPVGLLRDTYGDSKFDEPTDEGRGMAQIVHDLAPGAAISFATAFAGETSFAENIRALAAAGASVIVDDVGYFEEPFFQDGPVASAINEVVAKGVSYFTAAGNDNLFEEEPLGTKKSNSNEIASWEAPQFRDAAECPPQLLSATGYTKNCLDFDPGTGAGEEDGTFGITVGKGETLLVDLQWAEPWGGVKADVDAYLLDESGEPIEEEVSGEKFIVGSTANNVAEPGGEQCDSQLLVIERPCQRPVEFFGWENESSERKEVQLAINRCFTTEEESEKEEAGCNPEADEAAKPRLKLILLQNGGGVNATEYPSSSGGDVVGPAIYGHAGTASAASIGAVQAGVTDAPEPYSSRGPVTHYFGPVAGDAPAPPLEQAIPKPDVVATDCGRTTFFVPTKSGFRFCGTSAAAPHAAAIAALARQANPGLAPAEIRSGLALTARPVGAFGPNAVGGGLVDAHSMLGDVALPPVITIVDPPKAIGRNPRPSIGFTANRPVSFACSIDGSVSLPCGSPFTPPERLADGLHGFAVRGEDVAGKVGVSDTVVFRVDTVAPRTRFRRHPRRLLRPRRRRAKAVFVFASSERGSVFRCRVDGGLWRFCPRRFVRRFGAGRHVVRVAAVDAAGNVDRSPATFRLRVKRVGRRGVRHTSHSRRAP